MNNLFMRLNPPDTGFFPLFDEEKIVPGDDGNCAINPEHNYGRYRVNTLHIILPSTNVPPIFWSWAGECIITEQVAELFDKQGLTGYRLERAVPTGVRRGTDNLSLVPPLHEVIVTGWGGMASSECGVRLLDKCPSCGRTEFGNIIYPEHLIDTESWDGSDFFVVWPLPNYVLITERVIEVLKKHRLRQFRLTHLADLKFATGHFFPGTLHEFFGEERAKLLGSKWGLD